MQMTNSQALFEDSVNVQGLFFADFVIHSPVAKTRKHSYCWGALKEKRTCSRSKCKASCTKTKISYKYQSVAVRITFVSLKHHLCY
jgi:hypothetical protein